MSVAIQKIDGVTSVNVTLKAGLAKITLKPGNTVTLSDVRRVIERNGFTPRGAAVVAEAEEIRNASGQAHIKVTRSGETFLVAPATSDTIRGELKRQTGRRIVIEGVIPAPKENPTGAIELKDVKPSGR